MVLVTNSHWNETTDQNHPLHSYPISFPLFYHGDYLFPGSEEYEPFGTESRIKGIQTVVDDVFPHFLGGQLSGLPGLDSISIQTAGSGMEPGEQFGDTLMFDTQNQSIQDLSLFCNSRQNMVELPISLNYSNRPPLQINLWSRLH